MSTKEGSDNGEQRWVAVSCVVVHVVSFWTETIR